MSKVIMCKLGPIPDHWFENEPSPVAKNATPSSPEWLEWIERMKVLVARLNDHGSDKYRPGDIVNGPY
jgi:hypothetical protein